MGCFTAKFRVVLKKVEKTTRSFRHDLNQVPYDYIMVATKRFKVLDLVDRLLEELWTEIRNTAECSDQNHPNKRNARRQIGCLKRLYK